MAITPEYQAYLNSSKWKSKRRKVLKRASYKCEKCGKKQATQIHHLTYKRIFQERLSDLLAVCASCHRKIHGISVKSVRRKRMRKQRSLLMSLGQVLVKVIR